MRAALETVAPAVPIHGALCMVNADLPMLGTTTFRGYPVLYRKALAKRLNAAGELSENEMRALADEIAKRLPRGQTASKCR